MAIQTTLKASSINFGMHIQYTLKSNKNTGIFGGAKSPRVKSDFKNHPLLEGGFFSFKHLSCLVPVLSQLVSNNSNTLSVIVASSCLQMKLVSFKNRVRMICLPQNKKDS